MQLDEYDVRRPALFAQGVWAVVAWLLGELQNAPISGETHDYPYSVRRVDWEETGFVHFKRQRL